MKNRMEGETIRVYQKILNRIKPAELGLIKQVLNNECLAAMKECIKENGIDYKLVPTGQHRCNQAERAIQTFKAHFIPSWPVSTTNSPYRFGATYLSQQNSP